MIVNSEPTSIADAYALIKVLNRKNKIADFSLLVNNVGTEAEAKRVYEKLTHVTEQFLSVSLSYLGHLPTDNMISRSIKEQNPLMNRARLVTPYGVKLKDLAMKLNRQEARGARSSNLQFFFRRMLEGEDASVS